ncbi:MAG: hypothetical protein AAF612_10435 [Planctomycetota bacterium]
MNGEPRSAKPEPAARSARGKRRGGGAADGPADLGDVLAAAIAAPLLMRTAVRFADRTSTLRAAIAHLAVLLPGLILIYETTGLIRRASFAWRGDYKFGDFTVRLVRSSTAQDLGVYLLSGFGIAQSVCILTAWVFAAWGAGREKWVTTLLRSVRRAWVMWLAMAAHACAAALVVWAAAEGVQVLANLSAFRAEAGGVGDGMHDGLASEVTVFAAGAAALLVGARLWLRALGPPAEGAWCRWPPVCNDCGYVVTALGKDADCPECGRPVRASLAPRSWDDAAKLGRWPWSPPHPARFGATIPGLDLGVRVRLGRLACAAPWMLLAGLLMPAALSVWRFGGGALDGDAVARSTTLTRWAVGGLFLAMTAMLSGLVMTLSSATIVAGTTARKTRINPGPAASNCAAAASRWLPWWMGLSLLTAMALTHPTVRLWMDQDQKLLGSIDPVAAVLAGTAFFHAAVFAVYAWCLNRAVMTARYANH